MSKLELFITPQRERADHQRLSAAGGRPYQSCPWVGLDRVTQNGPMDNITLLRCPAEKSRLSTNCT